MRKHIHAWCRALFMVAINYGFNHFTNGSLALNYTRNKFSLRFNYQVKYEDDVNKGFLNRYYRTNGDSLSQQIRALRTVLNNIALGVTIKPNMKNKIDADFRLILPRLNTVQDLSNDWFHDGGLFHENRRRNVTWNRENLDTCHQHLLSSFSGKHRLVGHFEQRVMMTVLRFVWVREHKNFLHEDV